MWVWGVIPYSNLPECSDIYGGTRMLYHRCLITLLMLIVSIPVVSVFFRTYM